MMNEVFTLIDNILLRTLDAIEQGHTPEALQRDVYFLLEPLQGDLAGRKYIREHLRPGGKYKSAYALKHYIGGPDAWPPYIREARFVELLQEAGFDILPGNYIKARIV